MSTFPSLRRIAIATALPGLLATLPASAGTTPALGKASAPITAPPVSPWEITGAIGYGMTSGNSDNLNLTARFLASYITPTDEFYFGTDYIYGETDGLKAADNLHAYTSWNHTLSGPFYAGILADAWYDSIADLDYRVNVGPTLGFNAIKNDATTLAFEAGPGYLWEKQGGVQNDYFTVRLAQRFSHKFNDRVKFTQSVAFVTEAEDWDNWYLVADAGFNFRVNRNWSLNSFVRNTYDNTPAAGQKSNDLAVMATISYALSGIADDPAPAARKTLKEKKAAGTVNAMGWTNTAAIGLALNSGNADNLLVTAAFDAAYREANNEALFNVFGGYGETDSTTSTQLLRAAAQYNRLFSDRCFAGLSTGFLYDDMADLSYRLSPAITSGYYLIKNDAAKLSFEAGPSYVWEKLGGATDSYFAIQAAEKLTWKIADGVALTQSVTFNTEAEDWENFFLVAAAALDFDVTEDLSFRTSVNSIYDNTPAAGNKKNDLLLSAGVAVRF
jgi:putative salt-induced outer membrane protein